MTGARINSVAVAGRLPSRRPWETYGKTYYVLRRHVELDYNLVLRSGVFCRQSQDINQSGEGMHYILSELARYRYANSAS